MRETATGRSETDRTRREGRLRLLERRHRLDHEEVDAAIDEALGLLAVGGDASAKVTLPKGSSGLPRGPIGAGHEGASLRRVLARCRAPSRLILRDLLLEAVGAELEAVGAEGVGLDDVDARLDVLLVDGAHEGGVREVQLVEAAVHEDAAGVEHRPHGAVAHDDALGDPLEEGLDGTRPWACVSPALIQQAQRLHPGS